MSARVWIGSPMDGDAVPLGVNKSGDPIMADSNGVQTLVPLPEVVFEGFTPLSWQADAMIRMGLPMHVEPGGQK